MRVELVVLICARRRRDVVEDSSGDNGFCVARCGGQVGPGAGRAEWDSVVQGDQNQGEGQETPAVVADGVEFEVVGEEVELGRRAEP